MFAISARRLCSCLLVRLHQLIRIPAPALFLKASPPARFAAAYIAFNIVLRIQTAARILAAIVVRVAVTAALAVLPMEIGPAHGAGVVPVVFFHDFYRRLAVL